MTKEYYNLEMLRIHELRDLARKMGVKSPTTLKREELIKEINKIMQGEAKPYIKANKQGRPARNQTNNFKLNDLFVPKFDEILDSDDNAYTQSDFGEYTWELSMPQVVYTTETDMSVDECEGFVDIRKGFGMLRKADFIPRKTDKFISPIIIKKFGLKSGDWVKGSSRFIAADKPEVLVDVISDEISRKFDFDAEVDTCGKVLKDVPYLKDIALGGRYQIVAQNRCDKENVVNQLLQYLGDTKGVDAKYLVLNAGNINQYKNIESTSFPFSVRDDDCIIATELYFEHCKREVEKGRNVVVVIDCLSQLVKNYNSVITNDVMHASIHPQSLHKIKEILGFAKSINGGSLTIINIDAFVVPASIKSLFEYEINPLFN